MVSILDMCLSCLWYIRLDMSSRQYMWAWSSGDRSDIDLEIVIVIVVAENGHQPQNMKVDATLQGVCVRKAGA